MIDDNALFHITFGTSEEDSPYSVENQTILYEGEPLPFPVHFVERCPPTNGRYFYFRHINYCTPTLDDELILNVTFIRQCFCCEFCQYRLYSNQPNITPEEGFRRITEQRNIRDLSTVAQLAIVTGNLGSSEKALDHVERIIDCASAMGFKGTLFYMGFELASPKYLTKLVKKVETAGLQGLRFALTVEVFSNRQRLIHGKKSVE